MIYKSLKIIFNKEKLNKIKDIDLTKRPSDLKPEIYYNLLNCTRKINFSFKA